MADLFVRQLIETTIDIALGDLHLLHGGLKKSISHLTRLHEERFLRVAFKFAAQRMGSRNLSGTIVRQPAWKPDCE